MGTAPLLMTTALGSPLVAAVAAPAMQRAARPAGEIGRIVAVLFAVASGAAALLVAAIAVEPTGVVDDGMPLELRADRPSALLLAVALATATVVAGFSSRSLDDDGRAGRYYGLIALLVIGAALVIVPAGPVLLVSGWLVSGWALVGLVGFASGWKPARTAQRRIAGALFVGDAALVGAVSVAAVHSDGVFGSSPQAAIDALGASSMLGVPALDVVALLLVVAGVSRSALFPFHRWLVGTIAAPSPVSALVHAGLVSGAGLLFIRFPSTLLGSTPATSLAFALGLVTILIAIGAAALRSDIKGGLAWSTVGQMAFMVVQCAVGALSSAVFHIAGHGMYKAALFLGSGDTVSARLRADRSPVAQPVWNAWARRSAAAMIATAAVAVALWVIPPDVNASGRVLVAAFAWLTIAHGLAGWLARGPLPPSTSLAVGALAAVVGTFGYAGGLRVIEWFVGPMLGATVVSPIDPAVVVSTIIIAGAGLSAVALSPTLGGRVQPLAIALSVTGSHRHRNRTAPARAGAAFGGAAAVCDGPARARIRADAAAAGDVVAPLWPLSSFVAVNPLGALELRGFDTATASGRRWLRGRTHLRLDDFRQDHVDGATERADLELVVARHFGESSASPISAESASTIDPVDVIVADLLHGPEVEPETVPRTALERFETPDGELGAVIDAVLARWLTAFVCPPAWSMVRPGEDLLDLARRRVLREPELRGLLSDDAAAWLESLGHDPADVIAASFALVGVDEDTRCDEMRGHLARLPGWAGLAKWRTEWAQPSEVLPVLDPIDVIAARAMLEALLLAPLRTVRASVPEPISGRDEIGLEARVDAVAEALGATDVDRRRAIRRVLAEVPAATRSALWLEAQEHRSDARLMARLDRRDILRRPTRSGRADVQAVFCIDVRSEGLRRHLEIDGGVETFGFAGFFGVAMSLRKLGWDHREPRCPVLVAPAVTAQEQASPDHLDAVARDLGRRRIVAGVQQAHGSAKRRPGGAFVLAEALGWLLGPLAAVRTFRPGRATPPAPTTTRVAFDQDEALLDQRIFLAESVLRTMGLVAEFAPIVMLCGHTSSTTNNPHATALECGACAGAAGGDNARAVADLLNHGDVRRGLAERGIDVPDDTWFVAGLHDTAGDHVTILDAGLAPDSHRPALRTLQARLDAAGSSQADVRAASLPGPAARVRDRGADWAQVRPEWGLAGNRAFIIGPRSMTAGVDLEGQAFLHTYDPANDPTGRVLETIMTAPLVVAHWISSQYYFSTVDPERFGAGDKLLHNPIASIGVVSGDGGDLRVGLPLQSTHVGPHRHHRPLRLLALIQADPVDIEQVIVNNPILRTLADGAWLRIAARAGAQDPWSIRTPAGSWQPAPRLLDGAGSPTLADMTSELAS